MVSLYWLTASNNLFGILTCTRGRPQENLTFVTVKISYQQQWRQLLMLYWLQTLQTIVVGHVTYSLKTGMLVQISSQYYLNKWTLLEVEPVEITESVFKEMMNGWYLKRCREINLYIAIHSALPYCRHKM